MRLEKAAICNAKTKATIVVQHLGVRITMVVSVGGGGRIRTIEAIRSRFTVCPLWPLGNSPIFNLLELLVGAGRRTRTPDLLITNQLLYQLSYTGVSNRTRRL